MESGQRNDAEPKDRVSGDTKLRRVSGRDLTLVLRFHGTTSVPHDGDFPVDDEMTRINCGGDPPADQFPPAWATRGIKNRLGAPYFPTIQYTNTMEAEITVNILKEKKKPTVGLVEQAFIPVTFRDYLVKHLPEATFVDATESIDEIRVPKSPEEIELIKVTAALQDKAIEH